MENLFTTYTKAVLSLLLGVLSSFFLFTGVFAVLPCRAAFVCVGRSTGSESVLFGADVYIVRFLEQL